MAAAPVARIAVVMRAGIPVVTDRGTGEAPPAAALERSAEVVGAALHVELAFGSTPVDDLGPTATAGGIAEVPRTRVAVVAVEGPDPALSGLAASLRARVFRPRTVEVPLTGLRLVVAVRRGLVSARAGCRITVIVGAGIVIGAKGSPAYLSLMYLMKSSTST